MILPFFQKSQDQDMEQVPQQWQHHHLKLYIVQSGEILDTRNLSPKKVRRGMVISQASFIYAFKEDNPKGKFKLTKNCKTLNIKYKDQSDFIS